MLDVRRPEVGWRIVYVVVGVEGQGTWMFVHFQLRRKNRLNFAVSVEILWPQEIVDD